MKNYKEFCTTKELEEKVWKEMHPFVEIKKKLDLNFGTFCYCNDQMKIDENRKILPVMFNWKLPYKISDFAVLIKYVYELKHTVKRCNPLKETFL
jgi:hypothetical protein